MIIQRMTAPLNGVAPLPHLGVIRAEGEDAAKFLHGQLTQDFALLPPGEARLAAFCTAKGRMLASFVAVPREATQILLVTSIDLLPAALKRLSMFVLRSKVKLTDATADFALHGLVGEAFRQQAESPEPLPWTHWRRGSASVVALFPADGQPRGLWLAPAGEALPPGPELDPALWLWTEVRSGIATVTAPISEAFVPQMLNYESVGGVNFKKGCYPGQEVVARSQFRGTLKRRAYRVHGNGPLQAGQEVFHPSDREQPCGQVAQAAPAPDGGWDAIVSMQTAAADGAPLAAGTPEGAALELLPLPYRLLADV
jgi:folate-binding protein YgfZ